MDGSLELGEVGVPRGLGVRDRLRLAGQAALAHEAAEREARRVGELARLLRAPCEGGGLRHDGGHHRLVGSQVGT